MARSRDFAAEYARRRELATERGLTGRDITRAARGRATSTGVTSGTLRAIERNPPDQPVTVVSYIDRSGTGHVIIVTHDAKGRAKVTHRRVPREKIDDLVGDLYDRLDEADIEVY